jgi:hypothetical protein
VCVCVCTCMQNCSMLQCFDQTGVCACVYIYMCVCVCVYICIHAYIHTYIHTYIHILKQTVCIHTHTRQTTQPLTYTFQATAGWASMLWADTHIHTHAYTYMHTRTQPHTSYISGYGRVGVYAGGRHTGTRSKVHQDLYP